ncbi:hypothetical protein CZ787_02185 [Halomonas citrativorans]|uniref:Uncharacterized protein n=1 Tax=Halomonas citrativorans TaxID=2742612 RepID=A0A1R4HQW6_9GAMM|nr:hypothetical protein CZ787_02185 [Halomonas citrativorans]
MAAPSRLGCATVLMSMPLHPATQPRQRFALLPRRAAAAGALALTTRYKFALLSDLARIVARGNVLRGTSK